MFEGGRVSAPMNGDVWAMITSAGEIGNGLKLVFGPTVRVMLFQVPLGIISLCVCEFFKAYDWL
jgi:hypothetical protein